MKVGIFGGVFNPPHIGHMLIAQQVLDFTDIEEIWFLPNYGQHPPKLNVAPAADRFAMTNMIKLARTKVSTLEIDNQLNGSTISLIPLLPKEHEYVFIMGADWLPSFWLWDRWEELLKLMPFLVFPRNGYANGPLYPGMTVLKHDNLMTSDISATKIRERVRLGLSIDYFVQDGVTQYIKEHNLYR